MSRQGQTWDHAQPCGTEAAYQRHQKHHEPPCYTCRQAHARLNADQRGVEYTGPVVPDPRPVRNGIPPTDSYRWRERHYPWARRVLAAAEAVYGVPADDEEEAMAS